MSFIEWLKTMIKGSKRILRISKYPDRKQFMEVIRSTGIGLAAIGIVGAILKFILVVTGIAAF